MTPTPHARLPGPGSHPAGCSCRKKPGPTHRRRGRSKYALLCDQLRSELVDRLDNAFAGGPLGEIVRNIHPDHAAGLMNAVQVALFPSVFEEPTHQRELIPPGVTRGGVAGLRRLIAEVAAIPPERGAR